MSGSSRASTSRSRLPSRKPMRYNRATLGPRIVIAMMGTLSEKQQRAPQTAPTHRVSSDVPAAPGRGQRLPILKLQRTVGNHAVQRLLGREDPIHDPLLDQYSRDTGLPRDTVTQHDPGYEAWILGNQAPQPPITITLDLPVPAIPAPNYSQDEQQLGAWERANFVFTARQLFSCDHTTSNGSEESFVTDIGIELTQGRFEYFIARHIHEHAQDRGLPPDVRNTWSRIHLRIRQHAGEHFVRYRQVIDSTRQALMQRFVALPTRNRPLRIPQVELETYVSALLAHLVGRLRFELWQTTCDWEHADYPNLLRGIPNVGGRIVPACDPRPAVPPEPIMPIVVTPGSPPRTSPRPGARTR